MKLTLIILATLAYSAKSFNLDSPMNTATNYQSPDARINTENSQNTYTYGNPYSRSNPSQLDAIFALANIKKPNVLEGVNIHFPITKSLNLYSEGASINNKNMQNKVTYE